MKKISLFFYFPLVLSIAAALPINGMLITTILKRSHKSCPNQTIAKRKLSLIPSAKYPGYLVPLNRDCTKKELKGSLYTEIPHPDDQQNVLIIKRSNFTEKEEAFANNPAYIGLPDTGAVWGHDCSIEKSSFFGSDHDYGFFPVVLFREADIVAAWSSGSTLEPLSREETKRIVIAENPALKEKYPFYLADVEIFTEVSDSKE